jgi:hypothetical protein
LAIDKLNPPSRINKKTERELALFLLELFLLTLLLFLGQTSEDINYLAIAVEATVATRDMTALHLGTLLARRESRRDERVMRPAIAGMRPRMSHSYNHNYILAPFLSASKFFKIVN